MSTVPVPGIRPASSRVSLLYIPCMFHAFRVSSRSNVRLFSCPIFRSSGSSDDPLLNRTSVMLSCNKTGRRIFDRQGGEGGIGLSRQSL